MEATFTAQSPMKVLPPTLGALDTSKESMLDYLEPINTSPRNQLKNKRGRSSQSTQLKVVVALARIDVSFLESF